MREKIVCVQKNTMDGGKKINRNKYGKLRGGKVLPQLTVAKHGPGGERNLTIEMNQTPEGWGCKDWAVVVKKAACWWGQKDIGCLPKVTNEARREKKRFLVQGGGEGDFGHSGKKIPKFSLTGEGRLRLF